jgi:hypothetical protein
VLQQGELVAWLDRGGHHLVTFPASLSDDAWVDTLVQLVKDGHVRRLEIRRIDGVPAGESSWAGALRSTGFTDGYKGLVMRG